MNLQGQTINDRLLAARHSLAGQGLAKSVCKATTEELIGPKKKHLDYLVHCTNEPNVSIPHLANLLIERSQNANWIVVYKALLTTHHMLAYGNERFMQYLASSNSSFNLNNFLDKGGVQGAPNARIGYDMSPFIRRYAKYLNDKALSYRTVAFDFCKVKRGKEEGSLRTMNADKLLKTLPVLQAQLDSLLEFDCQSNDLTNSVINMCFMLLFRDLIRLFACYNDGIINLLEKYFDMNKKQARDALDLYKRFLVRMDKVGEFLKVAENVGIDKGDIPDLTKAPSSLLDALEQHLATLEGRKGSAANTPTQSASSSFGTAVASTKFDSGTNGIDDAIKAQALAEEEAVMNQYKSKVASPTSSNQMTNNPFLSTPPASQANTNIVDLFGGDGSGGTSTKASDDLLQLGNPFADMFGGSTPAAGGGAPAPVQGANNIWMSNGFNGSVSQQSNTFVSDSNFSSVFGNTEPSAVTDLATSSTLPNPFFESDDNQTGEKLLQYQFEDQHDPVQLQLLSGDISQHQYTGIRSPPDGSVSLRRQSGAGTVVVVASALNNSVVNQPIKTAFQDLNDSIRFAMGSPRRPSLAEIRAESIEFNIGNTTVENSISKTVDLYSNQGLSSIQESMEIIAGYNKNVLVDGSQTQAAFQAPNVRDESPENKSSDDLLQLGNPFADMFGGSIPAAGGHKNLQQCFDALGDVLKPASSMMGSGGQQLLQQHQQQHQQQLFQTGNVLVTGAVQGQQNNQPGGAQPAQPGKIITGDLDSSLASLVDNLNMTKSGSTKGVNWNSPKNTAKPGNNWSPQPMAATTGAGYRPMAQGMTVSPAPITLNHQFIHASYPVIPNFMQQGMPMMGGQPMMPAGMMPPTVATGMTPQMMQQSTVTNPATQNGKSADPFGAI